VKKNPSFLIQTLGCKLNQLESEAITDTFLKAGFTAAQSGESASVIVINTCTVTSKADQKARRLIRKVLRDYPDSQVIVTGCYAQLDKDELQKLDDGNPQRLYIIKKDEILEFISKNFLEEISHGGTEAQSLINENNPCKSVKISGHYYPSGQFEFNPEKFSSHTRSFLKIQDGCDNKCTYCRIRLARGQSISLDAEEVLSRLRMLEKNHAEAVLTGVNICQYGKKILTTEDTEEHGGRESSRDIINNKNFNLAELLDYLLSNTEKINIRLSSLEPESINEDFVKIISHKRIRPHFHLSVQSCSETVLKRMGRNYNSQIIEKTVTLLRSVKDDPFIACDIITGFPGETKNEFEQTYKLCQKLDFAWIHVFPYSKRKGTPAYSFKENVTDNEVKKRVALFTGLAEKGKIAYIQRWLGREADVIVENRNNDKKQGVCYGVTENYLKALVLHNEDHDLKPGEVFRCRVVKKGKNKDYDVETVLMRRV